jgi:hypothetical protein
MALCIEPKLTYKGLEATLSASIQTYHLTPDLEPEPKPTEASLRGRIVKGGLTATVVSSSVTSTVASGSLLYAAAKATLSHVNFHATMTSQEMPKATLSGKESVKATLTMGEIVKAGLRSSMVEGYFAVHCPISFVTSCFSLGGWDNDLGWDNDKGWKD